MPRVQKVITELHSDINNKDILEVACGCAEFSIYASKIARSVHCIDLDNTRLLPEAANCNGLTFEIMDATAMTYTDAFFDTVVMYNAIGHLEHILEAIIDEIQRVLRPNGNIYVISSFKLDKCTIHNKLLPLLKKQEIAYDLQEDSLFTYIQITKLQ